MKLLGKLTGSSGNKGGEQSSLFSRSLDGFNSMAALFATVFAVPVIWASFEPWIAREILRLYGEDVGFLMFWGLKLGAYPLVFFGIRLSLTTTYATIALSLAMRLL